VDSVGALLESAGIWPYAVLFALAAAESSAFLGFVVPGETFVITAGVIASGGGLELEGLVFVVVREPSSATPLAI
jgi:membrane-associated protein